MSILAPLLFRCDAGPQIGLGHVVRCLALAEAFLNRGHAVEFVSDFGGLEWPARQLAERGLPHAPPQDPSPAHLVAYAAEKGAAAVIVDSYQPTSDDLAALCGHGFVVAALDDEAKRALPVDVLINQNLGAEKLPYETRADTMKLLGSEYALLRRELITARERGLQREHPLVAMNVALMMGGTDPRGLAVTALQALAATKWPLTVRWIASRLPADVPDLPTLEIEVVAGADDVAPHFLWCDLALSAAGSTAWELACLGAPMALVSAFANQQIIYDNLLRAGAAAGLGGAADAEPTAWCDKLIPLLEDATLRGHLSRTAAVLVDGKGAERVAAAIWSCVEKEKA
ncbi:MAG: hypothetical protein P9L99_13265 [Candidatus Lernaella stagnicola]|nr:hypothetical protein [Candidatus Lernaella stagnicola]